MRDTIQAALLALMVASSVYARPMTTASSSRLMAETNSLTANRSGVPMAGAAASRRSWWLAARPTTGNASSAARPHAAVARSGTRVVRGAVVPFTAIVRSVQRSGFPNALLTLEILATGSRAGGGTTGGTAPGTGLAGKRIVVRSEAAPGADRKASFGDERFVNLAGAYYLTPGDRIRGALLQEDGGWSLAYIERPPSVRSAVRPESRPGPSTRPKEPLKITTTPKPPATATGSASSRSPSPWSAPSVTAPRSTPSGSAAMRSPGVSPSVSSRRTAVSSTAAKVPSLRTELATDREVYLPGEDVSIRLTVSNVGTAPALFQFNDGQRYEMVVRRGGAEVWRWSRDRFFPRALTRLSLAPGESMTFREVWPGIDGDDEPLPPGSYQVVGWITARGHVSLTESSVEVTIEEITKVRVADLLASPRSYLGKEITLEGAYRARLVERNQPLVQGKPPVSRTDWILRDATGSIYVSGRGGIDLGDADINRQVRVSGRVRMDPENRLYLRASAVARLTNRLERE